MLGNSVLHAEILGDYPMNARHDESLPTYGVRSTSSEGLAFIPLWSVGDLAKTAAYDLLPCLAHGEHFLRTDSMDVGNLVIVTSLSDWPLTSSLLRADFPAGKVSTTETSNPSTSLRSSSMVIGLGNSRLTASRQLTAQLGP